MAKPAASLDNQEKMKALIVGLTGLLAGASTAAGVLLLTGRLAMIGF